MISRREEKKKKKKTMKTCNILVAPRSVMRGRFNDDGYEWGRIARC
jgi:hypothetical protein